MELGGVVDVVGAWGRTRVEIRMIRGSREGVTLRMVVGEFRRLTGRSHQTTTDVGITRQSAPTQVSLGVGLARCEEKISKKDR